MTTPAPTPAHLRNLLGVAFLGLPVAALGHDPEAPASAEPQLLEQVPLEWPDDAAPTATGTVRLRVGVDAAGAVVEVIGLDGPDVFRASAEAAAWRLRFAPATVNGVPVAATTVVRFDFAWTPPPQDGDEPAFHIEVHATNPDLEDTHARVTLDADALERTEPSAKLGNSSPCGFSTSKNFCFAPQHGPSPLLSYASPVNARCPPTTRQPRRSTGRRHPCLGAPAPASAADPQGARRPLAPGFVVAPRRGTPQASAAKAPGRSAPARCLAAQRAHR